MTAQELANLLGGSVDGDPDVKVNRPSKIEEGGEGSISFLGNPKYESYAYTSTASILLVSKDFQPSRPLKATLVRVDNVYASVAILMGHFSESLSNQEGGIATTAIIHPDAKIGKDVFIGDFCILDAGAMIGDRCRIHAQVYIGSGVQIGAGSLLYPGVRILKDSQIGSACIIHPNVVIGADGFGFAPSSDGTYKKIAQLGNVILEDEVEVGAGSTIDRASMGSTIIRRGAKLDNLVQIAHNVEIGENTVIAAQTGVAGSAKIGKNCRIGGQVGIAGHLTIADGVQIQAQSGISSSVVTPGKALFGYPAIDYKDYIRSYSVFKKLPELYKSLARLEKLVKGEK